MQAEWEDTMRKTSFAPQEPIHETMKRMVKKRKNNIEL
jgi:hypothetical protein